MGEHQLIYITLSPDFYVIGLCEVLASEFEKKPGKIREKSSSSSILNHSFTFLTRRYTVAYTLFFAANQIKKFVTTTL
jgi:hypothetical protein